jgi:integrase
MPNASRRPRTLEAYLANWLEHIAKTRRSKTHELYEAIVRNHIVPHLGARSLAKLKRRDIRELLDMLNDRAGSRTRQLVHRILRYALREAVEDELIAQNPCVRGDKPRHEAAYRPTLELDQVQRFLACAQTGEYHELFFLALATGMRQGEIFGLRWDAVDFGSASLYVRATLARGKDGTPTLIPPKSSRRRRIDLGERLVQLLRELKQRQSPQSIWVFTDPRGEPLEKNRFVRGVFHPLLRQAGIQRIRFHDLRHTCATLALSSGVNVKVISERLGHSSAKMTLDVYARALPTLQREAAERLEAVIAPRAATASPRHGRRSNRREAPARSSCRAGRSTRSGRWRHVWLGSSTLSSTNHRRAPSRPGR